MASRSPVQALEDILASIITIKLIVKRNPTFKAFASDRISISATERELQIISEAARYLPVRLTTQYPNIPWTDIKGLGNVLRHDYEHVQPALLWSIIHDNLKDLKKACSAMRESS